METVSSNTTVARTATEALLCKASSACLGEDGGVVHGSATTARRQTPLLNRFYHMRSRLMHSMVSACVEMLLNAAHAAGRAPMQLLILGAGMDTSFERAHASSSCVVFLVDLPEIVDHRATTTSTTNGSSSCGAARAVAGDLRDADGVWQRLVEQGFRREAPTAVLAECVLCYLETDKVQRLLEALARRLTQHALMVLYDPTLPSPAGDAVGSAGTHEPDGFAATMRRQFRARGAPLLHCCGSVGAHCAFVRACGWPHVAGTTVHEAWQAFVAPARRSVPADAEPFDEYAALARLCRSYTVTLAGGHAASFRAAWATLTGGPGGGDERALHARIAAAERRLTALEARASARDPATALPAVRPATPADSAAAAALIATCFKGAMAAVPSVKRYMERGLRGFDLRKEYGVGEKEEAGHGGMFWVAEGPQGIVGCVGLKAGSSGVGGEAGAGGWEVSHLCVHPGSRGRGVAKALLAALLAHARAAAARRRRGGAPAPPLRLHLTVLPSVQRPAWVLYQAAGFVDEGAPVVLPAATAGASHHMQHMVLAL